MSRPKPKVVLSCPVDNKMIEICEADAVYAVYYRGKPMKIRTRQHDVYDGYKYGKCSFPESGHAIGLARRLNELFQTTEFTVVRLRIGQEFSIDKV